MEHKMATMQSPVPQHISSVVFFHFKPPTFTYVSTWKRKKKNLEIYYKYLGNDKICYIVKTCCIISIFSQNTINFILLHSSVQTILMFSINKALKFIYQPGHLKVKYTLYISVKHFTYLLTYSMEQSPSWEANQ